MNEISKKESRFVLAGCLCLMFAIASYGLSLSTIQGPILASLGGEQYFSQITVVSAIALCVMTPIGGRLCDMMGGQKLMIVFGSISIAAGLIMAFVPNLWVFLITRVILAACIGAYASLPFILVRQVMPPKQVPKGIGYLTMVSAIGAVAGSFLAGWLEGLGQLGLAMGFPVIAVILGVLLIGRYLHVKPTLPFELDWPGIILLTITLSGILMGLNNGPSWGWYSFGILFSFFAGIAGLIAFIYWENRAHLPLMPMSMFRKKEYSLLLIIGFTLMFYMNALNVYIPLAVQNILEASTAVSGMLQIPKTIVTILLPAAAGTWVVKKTGNIWKALAIAAVFIILPFGLLVFLGPKMPVWFVMASIALIGASDSFRSVGLLPAAQNILEPKDIGVGTSLIGFISTLSGSIASAFFGLAYDSLCAKTPGMRGMIDGVDTINLLVCLLGCIGFLLVVLFFRPMLMERAAAKERGAAEK